MEIKIYVDGSFGDSDGRAHGGLVVYGEDGSKSAMHVYTTLSSFISMRNVGGEILAAYCAVKSVALRFSKEPLCKEKCDVTVYHDYEGVGKWYNGDWRAKKPATAWYTRKLHELVNKCPNVDLNFEWVRGHDTCDGNKEADAIASYDAFFAVTTGVPVVCMDNLLISEGCIS